MPKQVLAKKIKTRDVYKSLEKFSVINNIPIESCDFTINKVDTYIKRSANDDFQLYNEDIYNLYSDKDKMLNEHVSIHQIYTVTIKKLLKSIIKLEYSLKFDEYSIYPTIIINPTSYIPYKFHKASEIYLLLIKEMHKIKVKNKILIKLFDETMIKNLKSFTKHIYANRFIKKIKIKLFDGINPQISRQSKLILWYKEKNSEHQLIGVDTNEVIIEFKKAIFGQNGFNAFGELISSSSSNNKSDYQYDIDTDTIDIVESKDKKLYKSKIKGFIHFSNNILTIDNKIRINKLSRIQTSVAKEEDNNIEVYVSQHDTNKDSIGEGVELKSEKIHITGHVGAKSRLESISLQIDGATHQNSIQYAKDAIINRHKGKLRCHNAKIKLLEGGEVHAATVDIDTCLGGSIYAENVTIRHIKNNLKVYASNSINIKSISGEDNILKINYKDVPIVIKKLTFLDEEIANHKYQLARISKHSPNQIPMIKQKIKDIKLKQDNIRDSTKSAKISIVEPLCGLNTIIFTLDSSDEIEYTTDARLYKEFYIKVFDDKITLLPVNKTISIKV